jgi:two-component sensor histidine kinase
MFRLTHLDVPDLARRFLPVIATQVLFAVLCSAVAIGLRFLTDIWLPGAGPFALTIPFVLVATLFGRWLAGVIAQTISSLYAWYFVLPIEGSFALEDPTDGPRIFVNLAAGFFVVALAEMFRRAMRRALADREMLLLELEHRVKNNFSSIASVLRLQMNAADPETQRALQTALGRVESFARAHSFLYHDFDRTGQVNMRAYIGDLCGAIASSFAAERTLRIEYEADPSYLPRDRAIVIGLLINEVATNSAKHAFDDKTSGTIRIRFSEDSRAYHLTVADNGRGMNEHRRPGSLGLTLIDALADQARGTMRRDTGETGTSFHFEFTR